MSTSLTTIGEMRSMSMDDLRKEIRAHQTEVQKMRVQITMNTEKDTGRYRREKKQLARMMTVMTEKMKAEKGVKVAKPVKEVLNQKPKAAKVSAPKKPRKVASKVS